MPLIGGIFIEADGILLRPPPAQPVAAPAPAPPAAPIVGYFEPGGPYFNPPPLIAPPPPPQPAAPAPAAPTQPIVGYFEPGGPYFNPPPQAQPAPIIGYFEPGGPYFNPPPLPQLPPTGSAAEPGARGPTLEDFGDPLTEGLELLAYNQPLEGQKFIAALRDIADQHDLDALAVAVNGDAEGFGGTIGDDGYAYGPWQDWMTYYKGRPWYGAGRNNAKVNQWAWSREGIDYVARSMAKAGAAGMRGPEACYKITYDYERPGNRLSEAIRRRDVYRQLQANPTGVWDYFAGRAKGPVGWSGAQTTPVVQPKPSVGPNARWKDLLDIFGTEVPRKHAQVKAIADSLLEVFS
jgi:hypothetical protein